MARQDPLARPACPANAVSVDQSERQVLRARLESRVWQDRRALADQLVNKASEDRQDRRAPAAGRAVPAPLGSEARLERLANPALRVNVDSLDQQVTNSLWFWIVFQESEFMKCS